MKLSALAWLDESRLLALERSDRVARLYMIDLSDATDILGSEWDVPADGDAPEQSLEAQDEGDLTEAGVVPPAKTLLVYLESLPQMPDKIEGIAVVDEMHVAVINDNDFAIGEFDEDGRHHGTGAVSQLIVIETPAIG